MAIVHSPQQQEQERRAIKVRRYDHARQQYDPNPAAMAEVLIGAALEEHIRRQPVRKGKARTPFNKAVMQHLEERGAHLRDVYKELGFPPEDWNGLEIRALLTDDETRPFFGPVIEEGFRLGIQRVAMDWEPLVGTTVDVPGMTVEWYEMEETATSEDYTLRDVGQGAEIPVATVKVSGKSIVLTKKARGIQWTDESLNAPVSLVQLYLLVQGIRMGQSYFRMIADRLLNGYADDGSDDGTLVNTLTSGAMTYADLLIAKDVLEEVNGFPATDLMASPNRLTLLRTMLWSPTGGPVFANGDVGAALGVNVHRNPALPDDVLILFNRDASLIRYVNKPFATEDERYGSRQITATYASLTDQIVPGIPTARVLLDMTW